MPTLEWFAKNKQSVKLSLDDGEALVLQKGAFCTFDLTKTHIVHAKIMGFNWKKGSEPHGIYFSEYRVTKGRIAIVSHKLKELTLISHNSDVWSSIKIVECPPCEYHPNIDGGTRRRHQKNTYNTRRIKKLKY